MEAWKGRELRPLPPGLPKNVGENGMMAFATRDSNHPFVELLDAGDSLSHVKRRETCLLCN